MVNVFPKNESVTTKLPKNVTVLPYVPTDNENNIVTVLPYVPINEEDSEVKMVELEMIDLNDEV